MKSQNGATGRLRSLVRQNIRLARRLEPGGSPSAVDQLRDLTLNFGFSLAIGELLHLNGGWYVTHAALLRLASRKHCAGIRVEQVDQSSDPLAGRWVFKATVYKRPYSMGFVGFGDADPSNVSSMVRGAELRIAETRAVNRALRKAYGIGLCSVEELGAFSSAPRPSAVSSPSEFSSFQRKWQRPAPAPRSALPFDPPVQPRCQSRESLCRGLLRHRDPQRRQP